LNFNRFATTGLIVLGSPIMPVFSYLPPRRDLGDTLFTHHAAA